MILDQAFEQTRAPELAEVHAASYVKNSISVPSAAMEDSNFSEETQKHWLLPPPQRSQKCFFCLNEIIHELCV